MPNKKDMPHPKFKIGDSIIIKVLCQNDQFRYQMTSVKSAYLPADGVEWEYWVDDANVLYVKESAAIKV